MNRALDLALSLSLTPIVLPALGGAASAVWLLEGRPIFFRQTRVGHLRQPFVILKLRTMRGGEITPLGRWLRSTGLDELPQLLHVLRGEMSLVGPRPLTPEDITRLGWDAPRFDLRWQVRPGVVGPAQFPSSACDARVTWVFDRDYVRHAALPRDLGLLFLSGVSAALGKARAAALMRAWRRAWRGGAVQAFFGPQRGSV